MNLAAVTRRVDRRGRILLLAEFAGKLLAVERIRAREIRLKVGRSGLGRKYMLSELLAGLTPQNIHAEVDFGRAVGKEAR